MEAWEEVNKNGKCVLMIRRKRTVFVLLLLTQRSRTWRYAKYMKTVQAANTGILRLRLCLQVFFGADFKCVNL